MQFDGVYHDSKIYLNGTQIGNQRFGYVSFYCDLTPYLKPTGDNVLAVFVDNVTSRRSHFYSGTGIYRNVWLIATDQVYIKNWGPAVTTPTVAAAQSQIKVQTEVVNDLDTAQTRTVEATIYDEAGAALQTVSAPITVKPKSTETCVADAVAFALQTLVAGDAGALLCLYQDPEGQDADRRLHHPLRHSGGQGLGHRRSDDQRRSVQVEGRLRPSHARSRPGPRCPTPCGSGSSRNCWLPDALPSARRTIRKARSSMTIATSWA